MFVFIIFREKAEEQKYKDQQKQNEEKRKELIKQFENNSIENIEDFMSIHDHEYVHKIWIYFKENQRNINEKIMKYLFEEIELMLKGSIYRSSIDEQWFSQLLFHFIIEQKDHKYFYQILNLIKKLNSKLKDKSHPSYIPYLGRILQRFIKENYQQIQEFNLINQDVIYQLYLSLILSNDYNTDDIHLNYFIEIHSLVNIQLTFKQLSHLMQCCLMSKNSEISRKFLEYLSNMQTIDEAHIDYIIKYLSINIRATIYDLDEMNRRIKMKREILVQNGETIFDLRAKLAIRKTNHEDTQPTVKSYPIRDRWDEDFSAPFRLLSKIMIETSLV